jgi:hypothetical protein
VAMCMPVLFFCVEQCSRIGGVVTGSRHCYRQLTTVRSAAIQQRSGE